MRQNFVSLFLTNEEQSTEVTVVFNGQQRRHQLDSSQLSDFYRVIYEINKVYIQIGTRKTEESFVGTFEGFQFRSLPFKELAQTILDCAKTQ
jgi:hypothetical protein